MTSYSWRHEANGEYHTGMAISKPILEQTIDEYKKQLSVNSKRVSARS